MPTHTFQLNGKQVSVDCEDSVRVLWVLRDLLGVTGPKYGCGINVCQACVSHIKRPSENETPQKFNTCSVPISKINPDDEITTIEGLGEPDNLHPMQQAWLDRDVPQCGYCQPGQIMAAVDLVQKRGSNITDEDIDEIRNICRCGTYYRIRQAIKQGAQNM